MFRAQGGGLGRFLDWGWGFEGRRVRSLVCSGVGVHSVLFYLASILLSSTVTMCTLNPKPLNPKP